MLFLYFIEPVKGFSKPAINRNKVVFPQPDGPKRPSISPCFNDKFTELIEKGVFVLSPYR